MASFSFDEELNRFGTGSIKYGFHDLYGKPADVIPLWVADMDFRSPPAVIEALERHARQGVFGYAYAQPEYHAALADWFETRFGWKPKTEWDQPIPGVMFGVAAAIRALSREGETVLIQQPVYYPFHEIVEANRRALAINPLVLEDGHYSVDLEAFERQLIQENVRIFLLCSPHNPVGRVWREEELRAMGTLCLKHGVTIISDEIHADFPLFGNRQILFPTLGPDFAENCVLCTSPSKTFNLMGLQTANLLIPNPSLRKAVIEECRRFFWFGISSAALEATTAAYRFGSEWLDALREYLEGNCLFLAGRLEEMRSGIRLTPLEGTYLAWLDCREWGRTDAELDAFFTNQARLWLHRGCVFGSGGSGFMRLNFACPRSTLERAMNQLERALNSKNSAK